MIMKEPKITENYLATMLQKFGIRATITREENAKLARHSMPEGFFTPGHELFENPFARYIDAGIYASLEKRSGDSWYTNRTTSGGR
jgi:hypothetical protein